MKKYIALVLIFMPFCAFGVPSVRMLGNQSSNVAGATSATGTTGTTVSTKTVSPSVSRLGSARIKTGTSSATTSSGITRFPVVAYKRPNATTSAAIGVSGAAQSAGTSTGTSASVNKAEIVSEVLETVSASYYDKAQVYDNDNFDNAVRNVDDARIDAIKVGTKPTHSATLPSGYAYIWIEE